MENITLVLAFAVMVAGFSAQAGAKMATPKSSTSPPAHMKVSKVHSAK